MHTAPPGFSSVCAAQNLWLAARAENVGVGWVSIVAYDDLRAALAIPADIQPVAYLCLGYVSEFLEQPELATAGWNRRTPLDEVVFHDRWGRRGKREPQTAAAGQGPEIGTAG